MSHQTIDVDPPAYVRREPGPRLAGLVTGLYAYAEQGVPLRGAVETASLTVPLIISFAGSFEIALGRAPSAVDHIASFAAGLYAGPVVMNSTGSAQCIQVNFTPLGGRLFLGLPMSELAGAMVSLDDLADREVLRLRDRLAALANWHARLDMVERYVTHRIAAAVRPDASVAWAFAQLAARRGDMRIGQLARRLDWSRRRLVERFRADIGAPPKTVARIMRLNAAQGLAAGQAAPDWADIAIACGYADQSHLTREFADLAGMSPTAWRAAA